STPHCYSQRLVPFSKSGVPGQKLLIRADGPGRRSGNRSSLEHRACAALAELRTGPRPSEGCTSSRTPPTALCARAAASFSCRCKKSKRLKGRQQPNEGEPATGAEIVRDTLSLRLFAARFPSGSLRSPPGNRAAKSTPLTLEDRAKTW